MKRPPNLSKPLRIYLDTSVFGGVFEDEFSVPSRLLMDEINAGKFIAVVSPVVEDEIRDAPQRVKNLYNSQIAKAEFVDMTAKSLALRDAFIKGEVVGEGSSRDALHVALAITSGCHVIASWNFRHIVHFQKIHLYNAIGLVMGYSEIEICSPPEVLDYEAQD